MTLQEKAAQLYNNPLADEGQNEYNQAQWVRAIGILGSKWLLAKPLNFVPVKGE